MGLFVGCYVGPSKPSSDDLIIDELLGLHRQSLPWSPGCSVECPMVFFLILRVLTRGVWWDDWNGDICYFTRNFGRLKMMCILMVELGTSLRSRSGGDVDSSRWQNRSPDRPHVYSRLWDQL